MNTDLLWIRQGRGITVDEWRLQWRSWGTWLVGLFLLAVVLSEHPAFSGTTISISLAASLWADRVSLIGSLVAILTVPFALDRVRRQHVAPIEFSKPFERLAYVIGKMTGASLPLMVIGALSMVIHIAITLVMVENGAIVRVGVAYIRQAFLVALPPLVFAASATYCLSVFIRRPIIIVPLSLTYLIITTATQTAADAKFSWLSPVVRPEYFGGVIPSEWIPTVLIHQGIYLALSAGLWVLAVWGFRRNRFLEDGQSPLLRGRFRITFLSRISIRWRMLWGAQIIAALLMALLATANTMSNPQLEAARRVEYALFGLEFYLPISGLLILAGVVVKDKGIGAHELVLTKPINRWRLLMNRLLPAMAVFGAISFVCVVWLHWMYQPLPVFKALLVALSTGVFLGMAGMTVANLTRSPLAGYGAGVIFWVFEAAFDGRLTAPFYLLIVSNQVDRAAGEIWRNPEIWLPIKLGLFVLVIWLFVLNGWFLDMGPSRRRAFVLLCVSIPIIYILGWRIIPTMM